MNFAPRCAPVNFNTTATKCRTQAVIALQLGRLYAWKKAAIYILFTCTLFRVCRASDVPVLTSNTNRRPAIEPRCLQARLLRWCGRHPSPTIYIHRQTRTDNSSRQSNTQARLRLRLRSLKLRWPIVLNLARTLLSLHPYPQSMVTVFVHKNPSNTIKPMQLHLHTIYNERIQASSSQPTTSPASRVPSRRIPTPQVGKAL